MGINEIETAKASSLKEPDSTPRLAKEASIWRNRAFMLVFASYTVSNLGNTFHSIAINLWVLQTTGSAKLMSLVLITHLASSLLFGSIAGTLADRIDRRKMMWISDLIRFVLVGLIAICMLVPGVPFYMILLLTALVAVVGTFRSPAFQASLIEIVGKTGVTQAVAAMTVSDNATRIGGFAAGGIAVAAFGGAFAVAIDSFAFLLSGILLLLAGRFPYREAEAPSGVKPSFRSDFAEGFRVIWGDAFIRSAFLLLPLVTFFFLSTFMLVQVLAVKVWQAPPFVFGLLEACIPLGYVIGSVAIMKWSGRMRRRGIWMLGSVALIGPCFIVIALVDTAALALPIVLSVGLLFSFSTTIFAIALRVGVPAHLQGRVFGLIGTLTSVAPPVGLAAFSALADSYGPAPIILGSGSAMLAIGLLSFLLFKQLRKFE
ncbi:MFS transporter [Paenibacillus soyae]|uniref:MFS transporter n=1 Tax=Paenibacillus soyae TaxID=2969249 RepID=A0A9X2MV03_9BACL|nr:MFS transporter [Paenibacillus soyae]MCR2807060.1 MFS transporter [Paenibacillus soyae]